MIGKRKAQRTLFEVPVWADGLMGSDSFYARMGAFWTRVSRDEDLEEMYDESQGKPSIPPSLLCGVLVLQYYCNVSDREAADKVRFDLRWKLALGVPLDHAGFHYSTLSRFRSRLMEHGKERYIFDKLLQLALAAGLLKRDGEQAIDSTAIHSAAAVQDTYTLLRNALRKLLRAMGESPQNRRRLAQKLELSEYLSSKKPELDWSDPEARKAHLQKIVADAGRLIDEAHTAPLAAQSDAHGALALLEQIVAQDIDTDDEGQYEIRQGVARDRIISTVDPEARHGRKSASKRWDGYKGHVAVDLDSELVTEVAVTPANVYDGEAVVVLLDQQAAHNALRPRAVIGDHAVIDPERRGLLAERDIEAVGKVAIQRPGGRYAKADFDVDLEHGTVTCPAGYTVSDSRRKKGNRDREWQLFEFPRELCDRCSHRAQCTTAQGTGRTVRLHPQEALLQAAREEQETEAFRERYNQGRSTVERTQSHLARHGYRKGRYFGQVKILFQALWSTAAVNLDKMTAWMASRDAAHGLAMA